VRRPSTVIDSSSFAYAGPTTLTVRRISDEPIVAASTVPGYGPIFNAGLIVHDGFFHLFARGVRDSYRRNDGPGPLFLDYISDVLVFTSTDGFSSNVQLAIFQSLEELCDPPEGYWETHIRDLAAHTLIRPAAGALGVGAGAPPVATRAGLLLFFHEREADDRYTTKVALLDDETGRVRSLLPDPIMRPELPWECFGDIDNIIFVQGAVPLPDGTMYLTYGAADRCVGAASVATSGVLEALAVA